MSKVFDGGVKAVDDVSLEIADGEFMVLVGPSGCGKTTLLRMIAGLEQVSSGQIIIGDDDVTDRSPRERDIAMVFQNYALYPHMTVGENLGFALKLRKIPKAERARRVGDVAATLGLEELLDRKPGELSGGQRQRVAIGRAMVREPKAFLMDEPLSNLDAKLRVSMRGELARLHDRLGVTTVYVTHDQVEAMTLGQRVAVLRDGVLQQVDTPQTLFRRPANLFVAAFIGSPSMNLVEADVGDGDVRFAGHELPLPAGRDVPAGRLIVGIRPTDFAHAASADPALPAPRRAARGGRGARLRGARDLPARRAARRAEAVQAAAVDTGGRRRRALRRRPAVALHRTRRRGGPDPSGRSVELAVDTRRMHFFDPATGDVIGVGRAAPSPVRALAPDARPAVRPAARRASLLPHGGDRAAGPRRVLAVGDRGRTRSAPRAAVEPIEPTRTAASPRSTSRSRAPTAIRSRPGTSARPARRDAASVSRHVRRLRRRTRSSGGARALPRVRLRDVRHGHAGAGRDLVARRHADPGAGVSGAEHPGVMTRGIASPETYYYRRLYVDAVRAVETAATLPGVDPRRLVVAGQSQGGALALAAAALLPDVVRLCHADVPFLCDIRARWRWRSTRRTRSSSPTSRCTASSSGGRLTLRHVDNALLARRIRREPRSASACATRSRRRRPSSRPTTPSGRRRRSSSSRTRATPCRRATPSGNSRRSPPCSETEANHQEHRVHVTGAGVSWSS